MAETDVKQMMPIFSGLLPLSSPRQYRREFDFTSTPSYLIDLYKEDADGDMTMVQAVFVENQGNSNPLTIEQKEGTRQKLVIPKLSQGIYPILATKNPKFTVSTTQAALTVVVHFLNVPLPFINWSLA